MDLILALSFMGMVLGVLLTVLMHLDTERGTRDWWHGYVFIAMATIAMACVFGYFILYC